MLGGSGLTLLHQMVNPLTMGLTLATFVGYAVVYTVLLKPRTPQNIVIMAPPAPCPCARLGRGVTEVSADALLLFLIIFVLDAAALLGAGSVPDRRLCALGLPMRCRSRTAPPPACRCCCINALILFGVTLLPSPRA
ncbi:UbiA family prenyltransferase [Thauera humireducens]|uniref:UbiA family prenyltransferase n=1 Tax=Thauera humireducens TaxID=1134435 RepID=UPI00311D7D52